jgi:hypothetical protein
MYGNPDIPYERPDFFDFGKLKETSIGLRFIKSGQFTIYMMIMILCQESMLGYITLMILPT